MFNKKLKKRIKSLEEFLGVDYVAAEEKDEYGSHIANDDARWSLARLLLNLQKKAKK